MTTVRKRGKRHSTMFAHCSAKQRHHLLITSHWKNMFAKYANMRCVFEGKVEKRCASEMCVCSWRTLRPVICRADGLNWFSFFLPFFLCSLSFSAFNKRTIKHVVYHRWQLLVDWVAHRSRLASEAPRQLIDIRFPVHILPLKLPLATSSWRALSSIEIAAKFELWTPDCLLSLTLID